MDAGEVIFLTHSLRSLKEFLSNFLPCLIVSCSSSQYFSTYWFMQLHSNEVYDLG